MSGSTLPGLILAGDIGGTKTALGLFSHGDGRPFPEAEEWFSSRDASALEDLIAAFVARHPRSVCAACFGIAGPVTRGVSRTTNLPWVVSEENIRKRFGWERVELINDLAATALSIPVLQPAELVILNAGHPDPLGTVGIVAPGTGLGMALMTRVRGGLHPIPSEGGHADFAPASELQMELLRHLMGRMAHVSVERLASGPGLSTIYMWLRDYRGYAEPTWLTEQFMVDDPSRVISRAAMAQGDPICEEALDMFVSIMGAAAGNLALTGMTTGGMYLGGGVCPKILPVLERGGFMKAFTAKGRFRELLGSIPVKVILNERAALIGAACRALYGG